MSVWVLGSSAAYKKEVLSILRHIGQCYKKSSLPVAFIESTGIGLLLLS